MLFCAGYVGGNKMSVCTVWSVHTTTEKKEMPVWTSKLVQAMTVKKKTPR